jgi:putative lipoic acid-binding regulatory protein
VSDGDSSDDERARAIALLESNHVFPTDYSISVIARNAEEITAAIIAAAFADQESPPDASCHERKPSSGGKYVSHRLTMRARDAEHVLIIYARLRAVDGVMTIL